MASNYRFLIKSKYYFQLWTRGGGLWKGGKSASHSRFSPTNMRSNANFTFHAKRQKKNKINNIFSETMSIWNPIDCVIYFKQTSLFGTVWLNDTFSSFFAWNVNILHFPNSPFLFQKLKNIFCIVFGSQILPFFHWW